MKTKIFIISLSLIAIAIVSILLVSWSGNPEDELAKKLLNLLHIMPLKSLNEIWSMKLQLKTISI